jgi:predicted RNA-binding protein with EMAP domain
MYNIAHMKIVSTTYIRKNIKEIIDLVKYTGEVIAIGRHDSIDALLIQNPTSYNSELSEITNISAYSKSFDFLKEEPDLYSVKDIKEKYV